MHKIPTFWGGSNLHRSTGTSAILANLIDDEVGIDTKSHQKIMSGGRNKPPPPHDY